MKFGIITLFPEMLETMKFGVVHRAIQRKILDIVCINPRDYTDDKNRTIDDAPFGGGPGMIMMAKPLDSAICAAKENLPTAKIIYLSPQGKKFDQALAKKIATADSLVMIAGRYDGIDQRIIDEHVDEEWSLGDFVISGGELAALVMIDAIARCIPGVVGDAGSVMDDSFYKGLLKYPQYTRPENYKGRKVPKVLLSGNHGDIAKWRQKHSLGVTWSKRPDILDKKMLSSEEEIVLSEFIKEQQ
ncbi:MAG: tRNA (guanosine(37)-N1)-methyltransferase TrmD [Gammaproteobacteria bacterium]|nr:tRNA (guanosine(37)-N1)-methyltransferase TrmD [Gammaproteobacteria bacterium]MCD8542960.1 tRNA (guanosine(37)-N1)-methyltransferase TrmD [Gammaproteobacteria bacterium]